MNTNERSMQMRLAAHKSWAGTTDRSARTAAARKASHHTRFLDKAREMHPGASEAQIEAVAESLRKAHYTELALKSAQARRAKSAAAKDTKRRRTQDELAQYTASKSERTAA
ncbi:hypothetical protein OIU91_28570 [Streptomyces sp. NBC_01456]|uniref:hypothetical protein n=1 Tax=unclassified Streptomyces TaxID=2593676 RepID=UPI002E3424C6|nr:MULTISPECIES: hypothetical protein [unclassified Streptomyces]